MKILHIEDERWFHQRVRAALPEHEVVWCTSVKEGLEALRRELFELVLLDRSLKGSDSFESLPSIRELAPRVPLIVLSADAEGTAISEALDRGADDYLLKTPEIAQELPTRIRVATAAARAHSLHRSSFEVSESLLVGGSPHLQGLRERAARAAPLDASILILGETGTGKEVLAREIHRLRADSRRPFVAVNCGAIPEALFESELFGHVRGAFTGAVQHREGLIAAADGGDLFLDEIGELPLTQQVKLLRFLQEGTYMPVGSQRERRARVRVMAATHRDLPGSIRKGTFREDLFYRLDVVRLEMWPLRERKEDIAALAQHFLRIYGNPQVRLSKEALALLLRHHWRGNIRELSAVIQRALVEAGEEGLIRAAHIRIQNLTGVKAMDELPQGRGAITRAGFRQYLDTAERAYFLQALQYFEGDTLALARALGISRATVYNRLKRLGFKGVRHAD